MPLHARVFGTKARFWRQNFVQKCFAQLSNFWRQNIGEKMLFKLTPECS